jgi:hypothetical protein
MNIKLDVQVVHAPGVIKNLPNEKVHGTLMGKPETQRITTQMELVKKVHKQNARPKRHQKPEDQARSSKASGFLSSRPDCRSHAS